MKKQCCHNNPARVLGGHCFLIFCICKERKGINPKLFTRIIRLDKAFRLKNQYPDKDWLTIAIDCGYYDYQHLVKDYKEFTGFKPIECFALETKAPERFFGDVET